MADKYVPQLNAIRDRGRSKWQRTTRLNLTQEEDGQLAAILATQEAEMKELLGSEYAIGRFGADSEKQSGIPAAKRVEIDPVVKDFAKTQIALGRPRSYQEQRLVDDSFRESLGSILTPQELESYMAYESPEANRLQQRMRGLTVDDATYLKAFQAHTQAKTSGAQNDNEFRLAENKAIEKAVGSEVAATIGINQDSTFGEISKVYAASGMPLSAMNQRYQAWLQLHIDLSRTPNAAPGRLDAAQQSMALSYYNAMTSGLTSSQRASFDSTTTGRFLTRLLGPSKQ